MESLWLRGAELSSWHQQGLLSLVCGCHIPVMLDLGKAWQHNLDLIKGISCFSFARVTPHLDKHLKMLRRKKFGKQTFSQKKFIVQIYTKFSLTGAVRVSTQALSTLCKPLVTSLEEAAFYRQQGKTGTDVCVMLESFTCTCLFSTLSCRREKRIKWYDASDFVWWWQWLA